MSCQEKATKGKAETCVQEGSLEGAEEEGDSVNTD